ncbi:glutathione S-transferase family protein [Roseovarius aquimarinus]|uniref:Glutathione S-transferase family protein n=1 Tax=Roseovarius aquimarinus TaxID=1229156 RepID=A0ABW7I665_9RHOB
MSLTLHYAPDNASLIVRLALEHMGQDYRTCLVDRAARAQEGAAYRALNPHGLIPTLETPDGPIFETAAILLWLDERSPGTLGPEPGAPGRGHHLKWLVFLANTLHPALRMSFYPDKYCPGHEAALRAHMQAETRRHFGAVETAAKGPFFGGDAPSAIDFYLGPLIRWAALYPRARPGDLDLGAFPRLAGLCRALEALAPVQRVLAAEGMTPSAFTAPELPVPPEGSAT